MQKKKARSSRRVLRFRGESRFEVRGDLQKFVDLLADPVRIAPDGIELNDQNVFREKPLEIRPEVACETSEVFAERGFPSSPRRNRAKTQSQRFGCTGTRSKSCQPAGAGRVVV